MSISELVTVLRTAYKIEDFDKIEQELVKREAKFRAEIGPLREKIELERLKRIEVEERLKIREEQCEKGKRAQDNYEQLLKEVKTGGLVEKHAIEELRKKNVALEREVYELKEFEKKMLDDVNSVDELRDKIRVLKEEKVGDKNALDVLITKNIELEEAVKKNLTVIEGLKNENGKLTYEKQELKTLFESLERRYSKLRVSDVKLEESTMPLMSEDPSDCRNTEVEPNLGVFFAVKVEKDVSDHDLENDTGKHVSLQRNEDTHYSVDTGTGQSPKKGNQEDAVSALGVKFKLEKEIVDLSDDDDDKYTSQGLQGEKAISHLIEENEHPQRVETIKRKRACYIQTSISTYTSSADLFEKENLPVKRCMTSSKLGKNEHGRSVTRLSDVTSRRIAMERLMVEIDPRSGRPNGPHAEKFRSYLGMLAKTHVSIVIASWDDVPKMEKNLLWQDILQNFDIPNNEKIRKKVLSHIAIRWRDFKTRLTRLYVFGDRQHDTPCVKYKITEEEWVQFRTSRESGDWQEKRIAAQQRQKLNDAPHVLSRGGYALLEKKMRKSQAETLGLESPDLAPPPARYEMWKAARTKSNGQMTSQSAQQISQRIDKLVEQQTQGSHASQGRNDILTMAIGKLDHPGCVRAVGGTVGIKDYFVPKQRSTESLSQEALRKLELQMEEKLNERMTVMEQRFMEQQEIQKVLEEKLQSMTYQKDNPSLKIQQDVI
ncbi:uncharacterized protein LOC108337652 [Vigna angularis]|nr:uncharacterized protein LOC108337652 [Vigna angularis]